jgi:hypothetical protein
MVPAAIDPNDSLRLHLLVILLDNLPGKGDDFRDDQDPRVANCRGGEGDQPNI